MRLLITVTITLLFSGVAQSSQQPAPHRQSYVKHTFRPESMARSGVGAAIDQARNAPHEWGGGVTGFGKRLGSAIGTHVVKNTIEFGVASVRHEEMGYRPSGKQGFGPRLKYALLSTVVTRKTTTGQRTVASGRISGDIGGGFISRLWQPVRLHTVASGVATSGILLGADAGTHVVKEFWPEIRHPHRHAAAN